MKYDAFMSYSNAADAKLAPALQLALQRFAKPWWKLRALTLFRDETSLAAASSLTSALMAALGEARFFILLASPLAAKSKWCNEEAAYWLLHRSADTLLIVLTEGTIVWDEAAGDFDWKRTDALPKALRGAFKTEPFWLDLSSVRHAEALSDRDPRFQQVVAKLAATLHGRSLEDISGEDVRQHRRTRRLARASAGVLLTLLTVSVLATFLANEANRRLDRKATILNTVFPVFGNADMSAGDAGDEVPFLERLWSSAANLFRPDGEELFDWNNNGQFLSVDCRTGDQGQTVPTRCPALLASFGPERARDEVPGLREMSAAIANAIADGSLNRMMADPGKGKPPDDEEIKANFDIVVAHAAMLIPSVRRKELAELKDSMVDDEFMNFGTGEPVYVRQIQIWRKDLGKAELIAAHLLDGGFCGSGGCHSPTLFFLRIGERYALVLVQRAGELFAVYETAPGEMPQIFFMKTGQSGAGEQYREVQRYDFDDKGIRYRLYMEGAIESSADRYSGKIPASLN